MKGGIHQSERTKHLQKEILAPFRAFRKTVEAHGPENFLGLTDHSQGKGKKKRKEIWKLWACVMEEKQDQKGGGKGNANVIYN